MKFGKQAITVFFLVFLSAVIAAHATYPIWSNTLSDNVTDYTFGTMTKDSPSGPRYSNVTFYDTLRLGTSPVNGVTVHLYRSNDTVTYGSIVATNTTNSFGECQFTINRTDTGTWYYKAEFDTP